MKMRLCGFELLVGQLIRIFLSDESEIFGKQEIYVWNLGIKD